MKSSVKHSTKVAAFDLDFTLIKPKSGNKFPKTWDDWKFMYSNVIEVLNSMEDFTIVIFTNQKDNKRSLSESDLKKRFNDIKKSFNSKLSIYYSRQSDFDRKPFTGMWEQFISDNNITHVSSKSFYCGDAAGRSSDHASTDIYFANNIKVKFLTPENVFESSTEMLKVQPKFSKSKSIIPKFAKLDKELVFLVGFPGSGKSTLVAEQYSDYTHVSLDIEKTKSKFLKKIKMALESSSKIIVDNTNLNIENRAEIIKATKLHKNKPFFLRCIYFNLDMELCKYLSNLRVQLTKGDKKPIPDVAYRTLAKNFTIPSLNEGFDKIHEITEIPLDMEYFF
ncbi:MAG: DNA 3'-phosphatase [Chloroflexi bacterium]|nr:DNA 3'-phosphatase [Chloroflexota bacterium]